MAQPATDHATTRSRLASALVRHSVRAPSVVQVTIDLQRGGLEALCADLAIAVAQHGIRSTIIGLDGMGELVDRVRSHGVEYQSLGGRRLGRPSYHAALSRLLRQAEATVVHSHHFAPLLYAAPARMAARVRTHVHTEHSIEYLQERPRRRLAFRWLARTCARVAVLGSGMAEYYKALGVAPDRLRTIPNGVDLGVFRPAADRGCVRAELGLPQGLLIGTVCRLSPEKNLTLLVQAFAQWASARPHVYLVIVGDGPERERIEAASEVAGVRDRVVLLGWRDDVPRVLSALDVFCISSDAEGLPLALLEAMACGCAVVSTRVGDVPDAMSRCAGQFIVPKRDPAALAAALLALVDNAELRRSVGEALRHEVHARFSRDAMVRAYFEEYGLVPEAERSAGKGR